jgi:hypothetical protein
VSFSPAKNAAARRRIRIPQAPEKTVAGRLWREKLFYCSIFKAGSQEKLFFTKITVWGKARGFFYFLKTTIPSGGSVSDKECALPCEGIDTA